MLKITVAFTLTQIFYKFVQLLKNTMHTSAEDAVVPKTAVSASAAAATASEIHKRKRMELFDCLITAEKGLKGSILEQTASSEPITDFTRDQSQQRPDDALVAIKERRFRGEESIFKKPPPGIMKCLKPRKTPGYQVRT